MSDFEYQPARGAVPTHRPRVKTAQFGDGYGQRAADGINNDLVTWNLTFNRVRSDIEAIAAFFKSKGGVIPFTWTPYGRSEILVICPEWSDPIGEHAAGSITCVFQEVMA